MKRPLIAAILLLPLVGCQVFLGENDFRPPNKPAFGSGDQGPYEMRLLSARSDDGVHWERTGDLISEQANVPGLIQWNDALYLYYLGGNILGQRQAIALAISEDDGESWIFKQLTFNGINDAVIGDPDLVSLGENGLRMYFTGPDPETHAATIYAADSQDGIHFDVIGEVYDGDLSLMDSNTFFWKGQWFMHVLNAENGHEHMRLLSQDGRTFQLDGSVEFLDFEGNDYFVTNEWISEQNIRMYGASLRTGTVASFDSINGFDWFFPNPIFEYDEAAKWEGHYIKDPAVVQLEDGSFFMVYVTRAPQSK